jgi:hypothetical protein
MNRFLLAALAAACITAAGVGGYLATRSASTVAPTAVASAPAATPAATAAPAPAQPVTAAAPPASAAARDDDATTKSQPAPVAPSRTPAARAVTPPRSAAAPQSASNLRREVPLSQRIPPAAQAPSQPPAVQPIPADPAAFQPPPPPARPDDRAAEIARLSEPPTKTYEELIIAPDSVVGLQIERTISTTTARVEDRVDARVTRDVRVGEKIAIPSGTRAIGSVTEVEKGGKFKERARLGIRFHTLVLPDGTREQIATETIYRDGDAPEGAQKVGGGAAVGAILGAILGGAKGAAVGAGVGGGAGAVAAANGDKSAASFPAGTQTTVRVLSPITITIER